MCLSVSLWYYCGRSYHWKQKFKQEIRSPTQWKQFSVHSIFEIIKLHDWSSSFPWWPMHEQYWLLQSKQYPKVAIIKLSPHKRYCLGKLTFDYRGTHVPTWERWIGWMQSFITGWSNTYKLLHIQKWNVGTSKYWFWFGTPCMCIVQYPRVIIER